MSAEENEAKLRNLMEEVRKGERQFDDEIRGLAAKVFSNPHVRIKVISQKGNCLAGHKVGDQWVMKGGEDGWKTPAGICMFAFSVIYPYIQMLMYGGSFPWQPDRNVGAAPCPDPLNPVVFDSQELKRHSKESKNNPKKL